MIGRAGARWILFGAFASALFVATHWPRLAIDSPVRHIDKIIHGAAFCAWTLLLGWATGAGRAGWRLGTLWIVSAVYAAIDEGLQMIPALGRTCSISDLGANLAGVTVATGVSHMHRLAVGQPEPTR